MHGVVLPRFFVSKAAPLPILHLGPFLEMDILNGFTLHVDRRSQNHAQSLALIAHCVFTAAPDSCPRGTRSYSRRPLVSPSAVCFTIMWVG